MVQVPKIQPIKRQLPGAAAGGAKLQPIKRRPELPAFKPARDPIDESKLPDDPQESAAAELDMVQAGFRERLKQEADRFGDATESAYYFVVCFESGAQATAFLKQAGMLEGGGDLFIDGRQMADRLGFELPQASIKFNTSSRIDPKLSRLVKR